MRRTHITRMYSTFRCKEIVTDFSQHPSLTTFVLAVDVCGQFWTGENAEKDFLRTNFLRETALSAKPAASPGPASPLRPPPLACTP